MPLPTRTIGSGLKVSQLGLGCMGFSPGAYDLTGLTEEGSMNVIKKAIDLGITFFDTAELYGPFVNEQLLGDTFKKFDIPRDSIVISTKMGIYIENGALVTCSKPDRIRSSLEGSLKRLQTDYVDLYFVHRIDPETPIELVAETMLELKNAGKIRHWGLSEASVETIRRAHKVFPLTAVQNEYSIVCREAEKELMPVLEELGIGMIAYSPLGRALLTATYTPDTLAPNDFRRTVPRLNGEHHEANQRYVELVKEWATKKGVSPAQIALAWVFAQRNYIVPIPGTTKVHRLEENIVACGTGGEPIFSAEDVKEFNAALDALGEVSGDRYNAATMKRLNK